MPTCTLVLAEGTGVALNALLVAGVDDIADGALIVVAGWECAHRLLLVVDVEAAAVEMLLWVAACFENIRESTPLSMPGRPLSPASAWGRHVAVRLQRAIASTRLE